MSASLSLPPTREEFGRWMQDVLHRLYDSAYLRKHPLTAMLGYAEQDGLQRVQHVRRVLLNAIHSLAPGAGVPPQSPDWRAYRILELRYIDGLSPTEVMQQLALSRSYYFREQARMLEALSALLWEQWEQQAQAAQATIEPVAIEPAEVTREQLAYVEVDRLSAQATLEIVDPSQVLDQLRPMIESLAQSQQVKVHFRLASYMATLHADRVMLRQALFNVITYALDIANGGELEISSFSEGKLSGVLVRASSELAAYNTALSERQGVGLDVGRQFMNAMGGTLTIDNAITNGWGARLSWPADAVHTLLVVDDNQGFADLFRRYLTGHNWHVLSAADGTEARQILSQTIPTVIVLDVMMPREDGWEILVSLRKAAPTHDTPIIICSVLNEPRLAQTLGANDYLTKPVTQQALLRALSPWN